jgi:hypothetical protein
MAETDALTLAAIEREILSLREKSDALVAEIGERMRRLVDVRARLRKHKLPVTVVAVTLCVTAAVAIGLRVRTSRAARTPSARVRRKLGAFAHILRHPETVARPPRRAVAIEKLLSAALAALVAGLAKGLTQRAWNQGSKAGNGHPLRPSF